MGIGVADRLNRQRVRNWPRHTERADPPDPVSPGTVSSDVLHYPFDHRAQEGMPRNGNHMPLLEFPAGHMFNIAVNPEPTVRRPIGILPLRQDEGLVSRQDVVDWPNKATLDVEINATFPIDNEVTEKIGPGCTIIGIDPAIGGQHRSSIFCPDEGFDGLVIVKSMFPARVHRNKPIDIIPQWIGKLTRWICLVKNMRNRGSQCKLGDGAGFTA